MISGYLNILRWCTVFDIWPTELKNIQWSEHIYLQNQFFGKKNCLSACTSILYRICSSLLLTNNYRWVNIYYLKHQLSYTLISEFRCIGFIVKMVKFDHKVLSSHCVTLLEVQYLQLWVVPCQTAYLVLMCPPLLLFHQVLFAENDEENSIYQLIIIDGRRNSTGWDAVNLVRILKLYNNYAQTWCIHSNRISVFHFSNDWKLDDMWYSLWLTKFADLRCLYELQITISVFAHKW